jgi:hypothetical protein
MADYAIMSDGAFISPPTKVRPMSAGAVTYSRGGLTALVVNIAQIATLRRQRLYQGQPGTSVGTLVHGACVDRREGHRDRAVQRHRHERDRVHLRRAVREHGRGHEPP